MYNEGLSRTGSVLDLGVEHKILEKKGSWLSYEGNLIGQGREAAKQYLLENPAVMEKISQAIHAKVKVHGGTSLASGGASADLEPAGDE